MFTKLRKLEQKRADILRQKMDMEKKQNQTEHELKEELIKVSPNCLSIYWSKLFQILENNDIEA